MNEKRMEQGIKGIVLIFLAISYLIAFKLGGIEGFVYLSIGLTGSFGIFSLLCGAFME